MLKSYFKTAIRILYKNKTPNIINIFGLSIGIAACLIIFLYIRYEFSYDKFHPDYRQIYRVYSFQPNSIFGNTTITAGPLMDLINEKVPEAEIACRWSSIKGAVSMGENVFDEGNILFTDQSFFDVFSFNSIAPLPDNVLKNPSALIITKKIAEKYFKNKNPVGQILELRINGKSYTCKIAAVLENPPKNSHFGFSYILSYQLSKEIWGHRALNSWNYRDFSTYVKLMPGADPSEVEKKINAFYQNSHEDVEDEIKIQAISDIHLYGNIGGKNNINQIYLFSGIAFLILIIAGFNYINLTTARSLARYKEIGIRKVVGANKTMIAVQFLFESIIITIISFIISIVLAYIFLPTINLLLNRELSIFNESHSIIMFFVFIVIFIGIVAGSYPAFVLSRYKPVDAIKNISFSGKKVSFVLRNTLLTLQFVISISLIIGSLIINKQMNYIKNKDLGYNSDQVIYIRLSENKNISELKLFSHELKKINGVKDMTFSKFLPSSIRSKWSFEGWSDTIPSKGHLIINLIDENFLDFYNIELLKGRGLSEKYGTDLLKSCIINNAAALEYNWGTNKNDVFIDFGDGKIRVVGIVNDFHFSSLYKKISPLTMILSKKFRMISIKINSTDYGKTISGIEKSFKEFFPDQSFKYNFLNASIDASYKEESKQAKLINIFTILSIVIVCLGLYGLASFYAEHKKKEISIRKVLGASVFQIIKITSWHFIKYILIATAISWPIIVYIMNRWLENFAFRIEMPYEILILGSLITIFITFLTVYNQIFKLTRLNLIKSLKYE